MLFNRRDFLAAAGMAAGLAPAAADASFPYALRSASLMSSRVHYCLNTSTVHGQDLGIEREIDLAAEAGYTGIEPWIRDIDTYIRDGGSLSDLRKRISDAGLTVESAIGFAEWIVDEDDGRRKGLETARRDMDLIRELGGQRIAAPPVGAHQGPFIDLMTIARRYRELLEVGESAEVIPQLEVWGFSSNLSRLGDSVAVCVESNRPDACLLLDVYHLHRGGSGFNGLGLLHNAAIHVFHFNDYPASTPREELTDADRVFPGEGQAPLSDILRSIAGAGRRVTLSLELFNRAYWKQDALEVARTGLEKMQAAVAAAGLA